MRMTVLAFLQTAHINRTDLKIIVPIVNNAPFDIITRADVRPLGLPLIIDGNYYRLYQARGEPPTRPGRRNR